MRLTSPLSSGVTRWLKADILSTVGWPSSIWSQDPCFQHEPVAVGHDEHDRVAGRDHAPDRMDGELVDHAALRRDEIDPLQLILRRDLAPQILIYLDDLQL